MGSEDLILSLTTNYLCDLEQFTELLSPAGSSFVKLA